MLHRNSGCKLCNNPDPSSGRNPAFLSVSKQGVLSWWAAERQHLTLLTSSKEGGKAQRSCLLREMSKLLSGEGIREALRKQQRVRNKMKIPYKRPPWNFALAHPELVLCK
jgi:hypothetical protein